MANSDDEGVLARNDASPVWTRCDHFIVLATTSTFRDNEEAEDDFSCSTTLAVLINRPFVRSLADDDRFSALRLALLHAEQSRRFTQ
jgi:hypothetical protein